MTARWLTLAAFALLAAGCPAQAPVTPTKTTASAAPVSDGKDYDPIAEGATWVYEGTSGKDAVTVTTRFFNVKTTGTTLTADTETVTTIGEKSSTFAGKARRSGDRTITTDNATGQSTTMLTGLAVGKSWSSGLSKLKVEGEEAVTVPAGTYDAALRITKKDGAATLTLWVADQVGLVKLSGPAEGGGTLTLALKSYSAGVKE